MGDPASKKKKKEFKVPHGLSLASSTGRHICTSMHPHPHMLHVYANRKREKEREMQDTEKGQCPKH